MGRDTEPVNDGIPRTFVFSRGSVSRGAEDLVRDLRRLLKPYTYDHLRTKRSNTLKDFLSVSGLLGVTHFVILNSPGEGTTLRLVRVPSGPSLTFRLQEYSTCGDLVSAGVCGGTHESLFLEPPLCVLNGFASPGIPEGLRKPLELCATTIKAVFPELDVTASSSTKIRRCVLFSLDAEYKIVMRQYAIHRVPVGVDPALYGVLEKQRLSLGSMRSMEDLVLQEKRPGVNPAALVAGSVADNAVVVGQYHVYLTEVGPRLRMELMKIEAGFLTGMVLYNSRFTKTAEEAAELEERARRNKHKQEREQKRAVQRAIQNHKAKVRQRERLEEARTRAQEDLADYAELKKAEMSESLGESKDDFILPPEGHDPSGKGSVGGSEKPGRPEGPGDSDAPDEQRRRSHSSRHKAGRSSHETHSTKRDSDHTKARKKHKR